MRPDDLVCHMVHSITPALVQPIQIILFWGIGFGAYFGFRTISRKTVLDNDARLRIFNTIQEYPGIHFNTLRDRTCMNRGTLRYYRSIPEVARGTLRVIIKDAGLTVEEFLTLV